MAKIMAKEYKFGLRCSPTPVPNENRIIQDNKGLVVVIARQIMVKKGLPPTLADDLVSAGLYGLLRRVRTQSYNPEKGTFSTFTGQSIRQAIILEANRLLGRTENDSRKHIPRIKQLQDQGFSTKEIAQTLRMTVVRVATLSHSNSTIPLEPGDDFHRPLIDTELNRQPSVESLAINDCLRADLETGLKALLTPQEQLVLKTRFDLDGEGVRTCEQAGEELGVRRQAISTTQKRALEKLRNNSSFMRCLLNWL